ncbi:ABC transporter ATP-binding protein/permease, partial [Nostoc sp. NIES-2111]
TKTTFISVGHRESLFDYHQWVLELTADSSWQLLTMQDYRNQKADNINRLINVQTIINGFSNNDLQNQVAAIKEKAESEGLSHKEMSELSDYAIKTVRSKASKGESITTKDGFTYRYDKDPQVLKWLRI